MELRNPNLAVGINNGPAKRSLVRGGTWNLACWRSRLFEMVPQKSVESRNRQSARVGGSGCFTFLVRHRALCPRPPRATPAQPMHKALPSHRFRAVGGRSWPSAAARCAARGPSCSAAARGADGESMISGEYRASAAEAAAAAAHVDQDRCEAASQALRATVLDEL